MLYPLSYWGGQDPFSTNVRAGYRLGHRDFAGVGAAVATARRRGDRGAYGAFPQRLRGAGIDFVIADAAPKLAQGVGSLVLVLVTLHRSPSWWRSAGSLRDLCPWWPSS